MNAAGRRCRAETRPDRRFRTSMGPARLAALGIVAAVSLSPAFAGPSEQPILIPSAGAPPVVLLLDAPDNARATALAPDLSVAAAAFPLDARGRRWAIRVARVGGKTVQVTVSGEVRALLLPPPGDRVYAVVHHRTKRGHGSTNLFVLPEKKSRLRRLMTLPPTASGLAYQAGTRSLLIACRDELRTVVIPELRSGPLFLVKGTNLSVAQVPGTTRVLLGRPDAIVMVDLSDHPLREGLPLRGRIAARSPVVALAVAPGGERAAALLADGRAFLILFHPLRLESLAKTARAVVWPGVPEIPSTKPTATPTPPVPVPRPKPPRRATTPNLPPVPVPRPKPPRRATTPDLPPAPAPVPSHPGAPSGPPAAEPAPAPPRPREGGTIRGHLTGTAAAGVRWVVVLGPDNVLHEAARVLPDAGGAWSAKDLPAGKYRIVLDAGPKHIVAADPAFVQVELSAGSVLRIPDFHVRRIW